MTAVVLDASALLAYLQSEKGAEAIEATLPDTRISSVNWSEVAQKALTSGADVDGLREDLEALGLSVLPFTPEEADITARLAPPSRPYGLSLGDRACLSVGLRLGLPILTTDRVWLKLDLGAEIRVVR